MTAPVVITGTVDLNQVFNTNLNNSAHVSIGQLIFNHVYNEMKKVGIPLVRMKFLTGREKQEEWIPKPEPGRLYWDFNQRDMTFKFEWTP